MKIFHKEGNFYDEEEEDLPRHFLCDTSDKNCITGGNDPAESATLRPLLTSRLTLTGMLGEDRPG